MSQDSKEEIIQKNSEALHIPDTVYLKIVMASFEQSSRDILDLGQSIEKGDYSAIKFIAHRVKGVYRNLRLSDVSHPAQEIDAVAKEQGDMEKIKENYALLKETFESLKEKFA